MTKKSQVSEFIDKIKSSKEFKNSETSKNLLDYLIEKHYEDVVPKEIDIAIDFFEKDPSYDSSVDSLIRSHIFSLRKKLEKYYLTQGRDDKIRMTIPKGHYKIEFIDKPQLLDKKVKKYKTLFYALTVVLVIIIVWDVMNHISENVQEHQLTPISNDSPVWTGFAESSKPTLFVLGDYYVYYEKDVWTGRSNKIRDGAINSEDDLKKMHDNFPAKEKLFTGTVAGYYATDIIRSLQDILPFFSLNNKSYSFVPARHLAQDDINDNNIVFIGPYKTLYILNRIIDNLRLKYQIYPHQIILGEDERMDYLNLELPDQSNFYRDYVLFAKVPGPNDNIIFIIAFFTPGSVLEKIHPMLDNSGIDMIYETFMKKEEEFPEYFEALFESNDVKGSTTTNVTHFHPIKKDEFPSQYISMIDSVANNVESPR